MSYIIEKLWHSAIIWPSRKSFQCILQGFRILLANQTPLSGTSENESNMSLQRKTNFTITLACLLCLPGLMALLYFTCLLACFLYFACLLDGFALLCFARSMALLACSLAPTIGAKIFSLSNLRRENVRAAELNWFNLLE